MCMATLVSGVKNLLYLKNEPVELTDFLHVVTISCKLKGD